MFRLLLSALLLLPQGASAAALIQLRSSVGPQVAMGLYGSSPAGWNAVLGSGMKFAPLGLYLQSQRLTPESYGALKPKVQAEKLLEAQLAVKAQAQAEAFILVEQAKMAEVSAAELPLTVARLRMLQGELAEYLDAPQRLEMAKAYEAAFKKLTNEQVLSFDKALKATAKALGEQSLIETVVSELSVIPAGLMTPKVSQLRKAQPLKTAWKHGPPQPAVAADPLPMSLGLRAKVAVVKLKHGAVRVVSRAVYRPALNAFRFVMAEAGEIFRKYISGREQDKHNFRFHAAETLFKEGDFRGSFGHPVYDYMVEIMSGLVFRDAAMAKIMKQTRTLGNSKVELSPMMGISGMSFPQLSAQSHLSLIYIHLKMAKELGIRTLDNTGEGGPALHLALLEGDRERVKRYIVDWNRDNGQFKEGSWSEAEVIAFVDQLMASRDELFAEFTPEDLAKAQVVAQFGSALNGIRSPEATVDFDKLRNIAESPFVAMTQYKLKQAAKRGAKVNPSKVDAIVASFREIPKGKPGKSPEINPDFSSYEDIAALLKATKLVTGKPVSLKFGIGDPKDVLDFFTFLKENDALPEHVQLDGRGEDFSPGSGNAPPGANTSLPANDAVIVMDAVLKKLGIREAVFVESTGDIYLPAEGVEKLALGADGISGARVWLAMGLGCAKVKACANGNCPYGIASKSNSLVGFALDPRKVAPKGYTAGSNWFKSFSQTLAETGSSDWRKIRQEHGLASRSRAIRMKEGAKMWTLDEYYDSRYVANLLRDTLTPEEVERLVFGR